MAPFKVGLPGRCMAVRYTLPTPGSVEQSGSGTPVIAA